MNEEFLINSYLKKLSKNNPSSLNLNDDVFFDKTKKLVISKNLKKYDGFVALGCVIKGQTPHFDFISKSTTDAIMNISVESKKPVGNGIITCLNKKQAIARGKKGREAANAVKIILSL